MSATVNHTREELAAMEAHSLMKHPLLNYALNMMREELIQEIEISDTLEGDKRSEIYWGIRHLFTFRQKLQEIMETAQLQAQKPEEV